MRGLGHSGAMAGQHTLIGFGEAASTFAAAGGWASPACAFDVDPSRTAAIASAGLDAAPDARGAVAGRSLVLSLVTADQALAAAEALAPHLAPGALWCDMNSVAPETKRAAARVVETAGAHYVDVAILAPVDPAALSVPLLLSGPAAPEANERLGAIGFTNRRVVGADVGRASTIKMIRSVMVKGIEALTDEMMAGATAAGVAAEVLASLDASEKPRSWAERAAYNLERMETHGLRRAAEMEEVAKTLASLGTEPTMTRGTVGRQRAAGERGQNIRKDRAA